MQLILIVTLASLLCTLAFKPVVFSKNKVGERITSFPLQSQSTNTEEPVKKKGFGKVVEKPKKKEKDIGVITYEQQTARGVPEYNIFIRPVNGTDSEWVSVGSMTIPRDRKVDVAIYEVEQELLKGAFKLYPKLKVFSLSEGSFEYGYVLKAFPDEPIQLAVKEEVKANKNFFVNW